MFSKIDIGAAAEKTVEIRYKVLASGWGSWNQNNTFPYATEIPISLGIEPKLAPIADIDLSSYSTVDEIEAVEEAWANVYRVVVTSTDIVLFSKEIPTVDINVVVKVVK